MVKGIWSSGKEWIVPVRYYDVLDGWAPFAVVSCVGACINNEFNIKLI